MEPQSRSAGWLAYASAVLIIGGIFAVIDGLMAVYKASFFSSSAVFAFSDLKTWGWIVFGLGVAAAASGVAVVSTRQQWARWTGVVVASLAFLSQVLFAQAYPLWSLILMGVYGVAIYGLIVHGDWARAAAAAAVPSDMSGREKPTGRAAPPEQERRAA
jgi:hypothetical protein